MPHDRRTHRGRGGPRPPRRRPHRGRQGGRRPGRRRVRAARRPAVRRPRADGGGARRGQDAAGAHPGRSAVGRHPAGAVHPGPDARRHHRVDGHRRPSRASSASARARSSPTCCWPTRSTGRRPRPSRRCWRRWRRARSRSTGSRAGCPAPFLVAATQNPVEYEGTYPLPGGPARPVPAQAGAADARPRRPSWRSCAGTPPGSTRATSRRPASPRSPGPTTSPPARPPSGGAGLPRGGRLHRRHRPRHPRVALARASGRQPARGHRAAARGPGLGVADRSRLRHSRRRQGAGPRHARPTGSGCAPRPSSRASTSRRCSPPRSARSRSRAEHDVASPGASRSCCSLGLVPVVLRPAASTVWLWLLLVGLVTAADWLLAPRPATLEVTRRPPGTVRTGTPADSRLTVTATGRGVRALVRDAWQPTAGATDNRHRVVLASRGPRRCSRTPLLPPAPRRPAGRRGDGPRAAGRSGSPAARRPSTSRARSARCRRSSPASTCPRGWPGCASSTAARRSGCAARAPSSTRCASTSAATTSAPSTGGPAPATATSSSAPGSPSGTAGWCWCSTRRASRPGASTTCPGWTPRWTPRCCSPRSPPAPATGSTSSPATARVRSRVRAAGARDIAARLQDAMADLEPVIAEADWSALAGAVTRLGRQRALVVLLTPLEPVGGRGGTAPGPADARPATTGWSSRRCRTPRSSELAATRGSPRRGVRRRRGRAGPRRAPAHGPRCSGRSGSTCVDADAERLPPLLADHYLALKARGLL